MRLLVTAIMAEVSGAFSVALMQQGDMLWALLLVGLCVWSLKLFAVAIDLTLTSKLGNRRGCNLH